jgi:hypothetical protein
VNIIFRSLCSFINILLIGFLASRKSLKYCKVNILCRLCSGPIELLTIRIHEPRSPKLSRLAKIFKSFPKKCLVVLFVLEGAGEPFNCWLHERPHYILIIINRRLYVNTIVPMSAKELNSFLDDCKLVLLCLVLFF